MAEKYREFRISVWVDDDTSHAKMLRGEKGSERLYCDVDPLEGSEETRTQRFGLWSIEELGLPGEAGERLTAAARWWIDAPEEFADAQKAGRILRKLKDEQLLRERKASEI